MKPSEYFRRNCFLGVEADEDTADALPRLVRRRQPRLLDRLPARRLAVPARGRRLRQAADHRRGQGQDRAAPTGRASTRSRWSSTSDRVIDGPDDITADWLTSALRASMPDAACARSTIEQIGTGQTGANFRLHLDADGLPPTLVAKTAAGDRAARERVEPGLPQRGRLLHGVPRPGADPHAAVLARGDQRRQLLVRAAPRRPRARPSRRAGRRVHDRPGRRRGAQPRRAARAGVERPDACPTTATWLGRDDRRARRSSSGRSRESAAEVFCERYADELGDDAATLRASAALTGRWVGIDTGVDRARARRLPPRQPDVPRRREGR